MHMKKIALLVLVAMVAASPAMAAKKHKRVAAPAKIDSNEASWRLVRDSFPIFLPSWAIPIYLNSKGQTKS
jgi:opacity protein-like surface antigen